VADPGSFAVTKGAKKPPFFQGLAVFTWSGNRHYRVYVRPDELVFIYVGSGGEMSAGLRHHGLLGALLAAAFDPTKKNNERKSQLDQADLDELLDDHKHNFRVSADEVQEASLEPYSFFGATYQQSKNAGMFRLNHADRGKMKLCLCTVDDMKTAVEQLPAVFGDRMTVNVEWEDRKKRFVRKK
jgi:hypothetical protein